MRGSLDLSGAKEPKDNEFIFDHSELDIENSPFLDMCKYIQKNSDLKIDEIPKDEMYAGDAYGFRVSKKT